MTEKKVTQVELASAIGFSQRAISKWLNNQAEPTATAIYKCAQYFGATSDYLLGLSEC